VNADERFVWNLEIFAGRNSERFLCIVEENIALAGVELEEENKNRQEAGESRKQAGADAERGGGMEAGQQKQDEEDDEGTDGDEGGAGGEGGGVRGTNTSEIGLLEDVEAGKAGGDAQHVVEDDPEQERDDGERGEEDEGEIIGGLEAADEDGLGRVAGVVVDRGLGTGGELAEEGRGPEMGAEGGAVAEARGVVAFAVDEVVIAHVEGKFGGGWVVESGGVGGGSFLNGVDVAGGGEEGIGAELIDETREGERDEDEGEDGDNGGEKGEVEMMFGGGEHEVSYILFVFVSQC